MLYNAPKKSVHGDYDRRWLNDDFFDLIIWYRPDDTIYGFQLCYDKPYWERALTWMSDRGFTHMQVDSEEKLYPPNQTPILVPDRSFPADKVLHEFTRRGSTLPPEVRQLINDKISEFIQRNNRFGTPLILFGSILVLLVCLSIGVVGAFLVRKSVRKPPVFFQLMIRNETSKCRATCLRLVRSTKNALHTTLIAVIFVTMLLSSGCEKRTADVDAAPQSTPGSTKMLQAADLVGYDGKRLRGSVDRIKELNEKHNQELEKVIGSGPDQ